MADCKNCGRNLYLDRIGVNSRGLCMTIAPPTDADDTGLCRWCREKQAAELVLDKQELDFEAAMMDGPYDEED